MSTLIVILGFVFTACLHNEALPDPKTASGVYVHSGFEYYRWEEGMKLMIWHAGVSHLSYSSTANGYYEIECLGMSIGGHALEWRLETNDGKTAQFTIDNHPFDLSKGSLFIINSSSEDTAVKQLKRDLSDVQADAGSVTELGWSDPDIFAFIQKSSEINDCMSGCISSTIPQNGLILPDVEGAQQVLVSFFSFLHKGECEQATALHGGIYRELQDLNPITDPNDHAGLFKNACTLNGAQCPQVRQATLLDQPSPAEFRFSVEFSNQDGSLFSRGLCCSDDDPNNVAQTEFIYTVRFECAGKYHVLELPVFGP